MHSNSDGRVVDGAATFGAASCEYGNGDEASAEQKIKEKTEESEEGNTAEEAGKDDGESSVDDSPSSHTLNCLLPCWNV